MARLLMRDKSSPRMTRESKAVYVIAMCPLSYNTGDRQACQHHTLFMFTHCIYTCHACFSNHKQMTTLILFQENLGATEEIIQSLLSLSFWLQFVSLLHLLQPFPLP